ncbi:MAG: S-layer homology domain-containing protein [Anaerovoracaceae bacterium]|jgi:hypothetical protein
MNVKVARRIFSALLALLFATAVFFMSATPSFATIDRGSVLISNPTTTVLKVGESTTMSISPYEEQHLPGCGKADCPQICGEKDCITYINGQPECTCGGTELQTYYAEVSPHSSDESVATVSYDGKGNVVIKAVGAGKCQISVCATFREYKSASKTINLTVKGTDSGDSSESTAYGITLQKPSIDGCSVTSDKTTAAEGDTVTITATAAEGYTVDKVTVTKADGSSIAVNGSNGTYTFTMPASNVTVAAVFDKSSAAPTVTGWDVSTSHGGEVRGSGDYQCDEQYITMTVTFDQNIEIADPVKAYDEFTVVLNKKVAKTPITITSTPQYTNHKAYPVYGKLSKGDDGKSVVFKLYYGLAAYDARLTIEPVSTITQITGEDGTPVSWENVDLYVPNGVSFSTVSRTVGTSSTCASVTKQVNVPSDTTRGHVHVLFLKNGQPVGKLDKYGSNLTTYFNEYLSMSADDYVETNKYNFYKFSKYKLTVNGSQFTVTAKKAEEGEVLDLIVYAYPQDRDTGADKTALESSISEAENIDPSQYTAESYSTLKSKLAEAKAADNCIYYLQSHIDEAKSELDDAISNLKTKIATDEVTRSNGSVDLTLADQDWIDNITEVDIDGTAVDKSNYKIEGTTLSIESLQFQDPERTKTYTIAIKSTGYETVEKEITVHYYGAQTFQIRHLDKDGKILQKKIYTMDELKALSDNNDHYYHALCTMRGITAFKAKGVYLSAILEDAGIEFKSGMTAQLRTNDSVTESDTNDPTDENAYYSKGKFDYDWLMQDRYYFKDLYTEGSDLWNAMNQEGSYKSSGGANVTFDEGDAVRTAVGASKEKIKDDPLIAFEFYEKSWNHDDQTSVETAEYDPNLAADKDFRFLFGVALADENGTTVAAPETTLWSLSYQCFGIDIIDGESTEPDDNNPDNPGNPGTTIPERTSYNISQADGVQGGTVSCDKTTAAKGETVTVTARANDGYTLDGITVKTATGKNVEVSGSDGTYTFTMPAEDVIITGNFTAETTPPTVDTFPFKDVNADRWSRSAVEYVYNNGIFAGTSEDTFSPEVVMNRAMFVTILYRMEGSPAVTGNSPFKDVSSGQYYSDAVKWASDNGIVSGYDADTFGPNDDVTREQMAAIFYRYANYKNYDVSASSDLSSFTDASSISSYAIDSVKWAVGAGIISGMTDGTLQPQGGATREQTASITQRFVENVKA